MPSSPNFVVDNHGCTFLLRPQNESAVAWVDEPIGFHSGYQPYWPSVVIELPYIADFVRGIQNDGLAVR